VSKREREDERPDETPVTVNWLASNNITGLYSIFSCLVPRNSEFLGVPPISEFGGTAKFFLSPKLWTRFTPLLQTIVPYIFLLIYLLTYLLPFYAYSVHFLFLLGFGVDLCAAQAIPHSCLLPPLKKEVMFLVRFVCLFVCLSVCPSDYSQTCERILTKFL